MVVHVVKLLVLLQVMSLCWSINTLTAVLNSIEKMIKFYSDNVKEMNVDGLYGLRVLEGQLAVIIDKLKSNSQSIANEVLQKIGDLLERASTVAKIGLDTIEKDDPEYFQMMRHLIAKPWKLWGTDKFIDKRLKWTPEQYKMSVDTVFDEYKSDTCMTGIMGTYENEGRKCSINRNCTLMMTQRGLTHYGITHQILWTMLAENSGCKARLERNLKLFASIPSLSHFRAEFCTNNYYEASILVEDYMSGKIYPKFQDLFLEQQFICPSLGFGAFLKHRYLPQILSWQHENGCYGRHYEAKMKGEIPTFIKDHYLKLQEQYDYYDQAIEKAKAAQLEQEMQAKQERGVRLGGIEDELNIKPARRRLLVEKDLADGCLSHKTAVAAGALAMYLRYLLFPSPSHQRDNPTLDHLSPMHDIPPAELVDIFSKDHRTVTEPPPLMDESPVVLDRDRDSPRKFGIGVTKRFDNFVVDSKDLDNSLDENNEDGDYGAINKRREVIKRLGKDNVRFVHRADLVHDSQLDASKNLQVVIVMMCLMIVLLLGRYVLVRKIRIRGMASIVETIRGICRKH